MGLGNKEKHRTEISNDRTGGKSEDNREQDWLILDYQIKDF